MVTGGGVSDLATKLGGRVTVGAVGIAVAFAVGIAVAFAVGIAVAFAVGDGVVVTGSSADAGTHPMTRLVRRANANANAAIHIIGRRGEVKRIAVRDRFIPDHPSTHRRAV